MKYLPLCLCLVGCVHAPIVAPHNFAKQYQHNLTNSIDRSILQHENWDLIQECMDEWHHECITLMKP